MKEIDLFTFKHLFESKPRADLVFIDVRTESEYNEIRIEGTTNIPLQELPNRMDELKESFLIVTICKSGNRAHRAGILLEHAGYNNVRSLRANLENWKDFSLPVVKGPE